MTVHIKSGISDYNLDPHWSFLNAEFVVVLITALVMRIESDSEIEFFIVFKWNLLNTAVIIEELILKVNK